MYVAWWHIARADTAVLRFEALDTTSDEYLSKRFLDAFVLDRLFVQEAAVYLAR